MEVVLIFITQFLRNGWTQLKYYFEGIFIGLDKYAEKNLKCINDIHLSFSTTTKKTQNMENLSIFPEPLIQTAFFFVNILLVLLSCFSLHEFNSVGKNNA